MARMHRQMDSLAHINTLHQTDDIVEISLALPSRTIFTNANPAKTLDFRALVRICIQDGAFTLHANLVSRRAITTAADG